MKTLSKISIFSLYVFLYFTLVVINGCELEEIPSLSGSPASNFTYTLENEACTSDCNVTFNNTSINADSYEWNFGDGSPVSTELNPQHTFASAGIYNVVLKAFREELMDDTVMVVSVNSAEALSLKAFVHTTSADNTSSHITTLDNVLTNNEPNKIIIASPVLGKRNQSTLGLYYYANKWKIFNQNIGNIATNELFHVVIAEAGNPNAFVHQTSAENLRTNFISTINHEATNNNPNARVMIMPIWEKATDYNNHQVGVVYVNNKWEIMNLDQTNLPVGLKFNVLVSNNADESFTHITSAASVSADFSILDYEKLNLKLNHKVILTLNQGNPLAVTNTRQSGLWYSGGHGKWTVYNQNGEPMPQNIKYNLLFIE